MEMFDMLYTQFAEPKTLFTRNNNLCDTDGTVDCTCTGILPEMQWQGSDR